MHAPTANSFTPRREIPGVVSIHDPVFPVHPFTGLLSVGREQQWLRDDLFPWFKPGADATSPHRCSYSQAREAILRAQRLHRSPDLALLSGARKSIPNLGVMGLGMLSHGTRGAAMRFGLDYQLVAGSMLRLDLQVDDDEAVVETHGLFHDPETRPFLDLDHLVTALNAIRQLPCDAPFRLRRLDLAFSGESLRSAIERVAGAPVVFGARSSRLVFDASQLDAPLRFHDNALLAISRQACEQELAARGVNSDKGVLQQLFSRDGGLKTLADAARDLGLSLRSLHRLLAREGICYSELADRRRQEQAQRMLCHGADTQSVAEALGFSDARCFRRAFRRWTGMAPSEYREAGSRRG